MVASHMYPDCNVGQPATQVHSLEPESNPRPVNLQTDALKPLSTLARAQFIKKGLKITASEVTERLNNFNEAPRTMAGRHLGLL